MQSLLDAFGDELEKAPKHLIFAYLTPIGSVSVNT